MATLLLGNGFSRAYDDKLFSYGALFENATLSSRIRRVFTRLGTTDFEAVMRRMDESVDLLSEYPLAAASTRQINADRDSVRTALVKAIQQHHPIGAHMVSLGEFDSCATFLRQFDRIFTTNYDLLLYWVLLERLRSRFTDGFGGTPLRWSRNHDQNVYYLHGALHLWDDLLAVRKLQYRYGEPISVQVAERISLGQYPLFVSEGSSSQKLRTIRSNPYLTSALHALERTSGTLLVYGFRFGQQDAHIESARQQYLRTRNCLSRRSVVRERRTIQGTLPRAQAAHGTRARKERAPKLRKLPKDLFMAITFYLNVFAEEK